VSDTAKTKVARTTGRRRGGRTRERLQKVAPAFIKREIPFYEFLGEEGIVKLEEQADWIIQEIGLEFRDDPKALEIWREAGADVKGIYASAAARRCLRRSTDRPLCAISRVGVATVATKTLKSWSRSFLNYPACTIPGW
jgi:hypothetical protein